LANISISRVSPSEHSAALHLATRGADAIETQAQAASVLAAAAAYDDFLLLAATEERASDSLVAAVLAQVLAGRAAVVWAPQVAAGIASDAARGLSLDLLSALDGYLAARGVHLAQFLAPSDAVADDFWPAAGYQWAGELLYLAIPLARSPIGPTDLPFELAPSGNDESRLEEVLAATYRGSLDCPLVDGLRQPGDVLTGYRTVGTYRPEWWLVARVGSEDAGCLILADHPAQDQAELVYLGIAPNYRGRGWGARLIEHARCLATRAGRCRLVLAVDARNHPARAQYDAAGALTWDARRVWIRAPQKPASHSAAMT
jgi:mycothiol synthase